VEAAGDLVRVLVELSAGVELGQHHLEGADALLGMDVDGDAASVVVDPDHVALLDGHLHFGAVPGEGLVDRVVDDLVHQVVESVGTGGPDIHAGPQPDCLQSLQDLDLIGGVVFIHRCRECKGLGGKSKDSCLLRSPPAGPPCG